MLRNLVPGSHLLLIWDVPGFIVCFQCPAGFQRWQGSRGSLPLPGVCAEAGVSPVVSPPASGVPPWGALRKQLGEYRSLSLPVPTERSQLETTESGQGPKHSGRPGAPGWFREVRALGSFRH